MKLLALLLFAATHQATLYYQNSSCTNHNPCTIQVWRAVCSSPTSCPYFVMGNPIWTRVTTGGGSASASGNKTTWVVYDQDPTLQDNTTYEYCATNTYHSAPSVYSACSPLWHGTTSGGNSNAPDSPSNSTGNSVQ